MTHFRPAPPAPTARPSAPPASPVAVADAGGMVWAHSNPAELYRWVSRRNALLGTIAAAIAGAGAGGPAGPRALAG